MKISIAYTLPIMSFSFSEFNIAEECHRQSLRIWQCPPFLVLVWGMMTIIMIGATYLVAVHYSSDEVVIGSVATVSVVSFIIGGLIIAGFNRLAEANQIKSEFIAITSHQLRSPLSIFKWTLDVIENEFRKGDGLNSLQAHIPTLRNTAENMIKLVNSILAISRIDARKLTLKNEKISLAELTKNTVAGFREYADASKITIKISASEDAPDVVADKEYLGMVVYNLIDNAIRYTPDGGTVTIALEKEKNKIRWSIHDEGVGIPKLQQKHIFEKFFRAGSKLKNQTTGSGIGLYIAKAVIISSGGEIGFSSEENHGSTFWFSLPASKEA